MRNLRERLQAVAGKPSAPKPAPQIRPEAFFVRQQIVPLDDLRGIEQTTLDEICACDPLFSGKSWDYQKALFLDTETTGLSGGAGTVAFEIGVGYIDARCMVIRQYVMRDYSEEGQMLEEIAALIRRFDTIVSFNGKSFDLPLLESRMVMNRIRLPLTQMPHLDLLHAVRRVYKLRLRRCNLALLEEAVLGQTRQDDLPGAQVPQRYFDYVKTKEFALLEDVLRHNFDDVKSLAALTGHLCAVFRDPTSLTHPEDMFGVGKTLLRTGRIERGRRCLKIVGRSSLSSQAHMVLASSYKRAQEWEHAVETCQTMLTCGAGGTWPYIELAKYYEHIARDYQKAYAYASGALRYALNTAPLHGADETEIESIRRRMERLRVRIRKTENVTGGKTI